MSSNDTAGTAPVPVQFKVSRSAYAELEAEAQKRGFKSPGLLVRSMIEGMTAAPVIDLPQKSRRTTDRLSEDRLAAIRELSKVGSNLNQLTRHLNSGGRIGNPDQVHTLIEKIADVIETIRKGH